MPFVCGTYGMGIWLPISTCIVTFRPKVCVSITYTYYCGLLLLLHACPHSTCMPLYVGQMKCDGMAAHNLLMEMETFLSVCFPFFSHLGRDRQTEHKQSRAEQSRREGWAFASGRRVLYIYNLQFLINLIN